MHACKGISRAITSLEEARQAPAKSLSLSLSLYLCFPRLISLFYLPFSNIKHCLHLKPCIHKPSCAWQLHLVDLAGSERVKKSNVAGTLLTEAKYINLSLHFLEQVQHWKLYDTEREREMGEYGEGRSCIG